MYLIRTVFIISSIILGTIPVRTQEIVNYDSINNKTYQQYQQKEWDKLINTGKLSLKKGIDYYYLRMRLGIAYYEKNNYRIALKHFIKAMDFNSEDEILKEYLYYSYLFSDRKFDATKLGQTFTPELKHKLNFKNKFISSLNVNSGFSFMDDISVRDEYEIDTDPNIDGYQVISKKYNYFNIKLEHDINNLTISHAYRRLAKDDFIYYQYDGTTQGTIDKEIIQHQYFLSGKINVLSGFNISAAIHILNIRIPQSIPISGPGGTTYITKITSQNNYSGTLALEKDINNFRFAISSSLANLNDKIQFQKNLSVATYPLGNMNLYYIFKYSHQTEYNNSLKNYRNIINQTLGFKSISNCWIEVRAGFGELSNYISNVGYYIYNSLDKIKNHYGISLIIPFNNYKQSINFSYNYYLNESVFIPDEIIELSYNENIIRYKTHLISGGILWKL